MNPFRRVPELDGGDRAGRSAASRRVSAGALLGDLQRIALPRVRREGERVESRRAIDLPAERGSRQNAAPTRSQLVGALQQQHEVHNALSRQRYCYLYLYYSCCYNFANTSTWYSWFRIHSTFFTSHSLYHSEESSSLWSSLSKWLWVARRYRVPLPRPNRESLQATVQFPCPNRMKKHYKTKFTKNLAFSNKFFKIFSSLGASPQKPLDLIFVFFIAIISCV